MRTQVVKLCTRMCLAAITLEALAGSRASADFGFTNFDGPPPNEGGVSVTGINNHGTVLGSVFDADFNKRGFTRTADGVFVPFALPNGAADEPFQTQLGAINDNELVAAFLPTVPGAHGNPLLLLRDGEIEATISLPPEFGTTIVRGLNNAGVMAGSVNDIVARKPRGYVRDAAGTFTTFDVNPTTLFTEVEGINNAGTVIGNYSLQGAFTQGFERSADGTITLLPTPEEIGGQAVFAIFYAAINDLGVTVGSFQDPSPIPNFFGFIRDPQGNFTLVQNPLNPTFSALTGINNRGTVIGTYMDAGGVARGFAAQPCAADLNRDGAVGLADLAILLAHFGASGDATGADGDLDGDGDVDLGDLTALLSVFGAICP